MRLFSIKTEHFRVLAGQTVPLQEGVNVITGANAQGKTTLLEAVYLLTGAKSFRTRFDREIISFGEETALTQGKAMACGREQTVEVRLSRGRARTHCVNGAKKSAAEFSEHLKAVLFSPDDLLLVRGAAAARRKMMDAAIGQLRPGYMCVLSDFQKIFEEKTRILREWREKPSLLEPLEEYSAALCRHSARLIRYRAAFTARLARAAEPIHADFSGNEEKLSVSYETVSTVSDPTADEQTLCEQIFARQRQLRQAELDAGLCLVGAHKDDLKIKINGVDARVYASQGQARTAALSLKLSEREILLQEKGEPPILLLDDVLSELDTKRQAFVLNRISGGQTLITCCEDEQISRLTGGRVLRIVNGLVS